jgi:hypothetical protein
MAMAQTAPAVFNSSPNFRPYETLSLQSPGRKQLSHVSLWSPPQSSLQMTLRRRSQAPSIGGGSFTRAHHVARKPVLHRLQQLSFLHSSRNDGFRAGPIPVNPARKTAR